MSLDRYLKDDEGFRKYVELMENTPTGKRTTLMTAARKENPTFVEAAEKYLFTFERITLLPPMELTEVLGAPGLKVEVVATAIASVADAGVKEKLLSHLPRNLLALVAQDLKDRHQPKPAEAGGARLQLIKKARELEKEGKLDSVQIPRFGNGYFQKKAA